MPNGITIGGAGTFVAKPVDKNGNAQTLPASIIPVWSASDPGIKITPSADGLTASVAVPLSVTPGQSFILTVTATLPDATTPSGTLTVPLLALEVTAFTIIQTA